VSTLEGAYHI